MSAGRYVLTQAATDVLAERARQVNEEGWSATHDDAHRPGELADAAACYATGNPQGWPWHFSEWHPKDRRADLVRATALLLAEIERGDRAGPAATT